LAIEADPRGELSARLDHPFADLSLLVRALTHRSYANEHPPEGDNEALAFLGDAVLQLVVTEELWRRERAGPVGSLTASRAALVSGANLARWATAVELGRHLRLGRGERLMGGDAKESVLATAFEAVLAVVYLEAGLEGARRVVGARALW